jgi:hypothetical protein
MAQVIAISKHGKQQNLIGGVRFFNSPQGRISEEITEEQAEAFAGPHPDQFVRYIGEPIEPAVKKAAAPEQRSTPAKASGRVAADSISPQF